MSTVITTTVLPDSTSNDTLTFGATGDSLAISGDSLNLNTLQDAGGNTIFVSDGSGTITSKNSGFPGAWNLISTQTVTNQASVSFTSGLDSTYDVYCFKYVEVNPVTDGVYLTWQASTDSGSSYGLTATTTAFHSEHTESDSHAELAYSAGWDIQQATSFIYLSYIGSASAECAVGEIYLFTPSSTTYLTHFHSTNQMYHPAPESYENFASGFFTSVGAINAVQFKMSSGNFDGIIALYGITKS